MVAAGNNLTIANPGRSFQIIGFYAYEVSGATNSVTVRKNTNTGNIAAQGNTAGGISGWNALPISTTLANTQFGPTDNLYVDLVNADIKGIFIRMVDPQDTLTIVQS